MTDPKLPAIPDIDATNPSSVQAVLEAMKESFEILLGRRRSGAINYVSILTDDLIANALHRHSELSASDGSPNRTVVVDENGNTFIGDGGETNYIRIASDGEITLHGTSRVLDVIDIEPDAVRRPVANPPGESLKDGFPCHDYDDTIDESVFKHVELTHRYADEGAIHVHMDYFVNSAPVDGTVDDLSWGLEFKKISIGDIFDFTTGTTLVYAADLVTQGVDIKTHQSNPLSLSTAGFVAGDIILMRIFRDASGTGNTNNVVGDVRVFDYHVEFLVDKLGEAT